MTGPRRILAAASATTAVLALAAPSHAATLVVPPCVPTVDSVGVVAITATGFTPGSVVTIQTAPKGNAPTILTSGTADPAGNLVVTPSAPSFNPFDRKLQTFAIGATDNVNPANVAIASFQQVRFGYDFKPSSGAPTKIVTHTVRGFPVGAVTYLHLRFGGRTIRNVRLGRTTAPCGVLRKRLPLLPARSRRGLWGYYVDQKKTFSRSTRPQVRSGLRITTVFRRR